MSERSAPHSQNRLLAALPPDEYERLRPLLERISFKPKYVLYEPHKPIEYVYFPLHGVVSMLAVMEDGQLIEVGTVGNEGIVGIPVFLGTRQSSLMAFWQIEGAGERIKADDLQAEIQRGGPLVYVLHRYTQALFVMLAQHTACNRTHPIRQRAARWILMTQDRVQANQFRLTQEFLGQMLGVRRAGVNEVMREFQNADYLSYKRAVITIHDRGGLERESCECYAIIKAEYDRMFD